MKEKLLSTLQHPLGLLSAVLTLILGALYLLGSPLGLSPAHRATAVIAVAAVSVISLVSLGLLLLLKARKARTSIAEEKVLDGALATLAGRLTRRDNVADLPWVVLFGPKGAGKSTVLKSLLRATPLHHVQADGYGLAYFHKTLFVDTPGWGAEEEWTQHLDAWQKLHAWVERRHGRPEAALILLSFEELRRADFEPQQLAERLAALRLQLEGVPLFIMVSHCDRLDGFSTLFAKLSSADREQPLGISLAGDPRQTIADLYDTLCQRTNLALHQASSKDEQAALLGVPAALRVAGEKLLALLDRLGDARPRALFLAAACGGGAVLPATHLQLLPGLVLSPRELAHPASERSWFLQPALAQVQAQAQAARPLNHRVRLAVLAGCVLLCLGGSGLLGHRYGRSVRFLGQVENGVRALPGQVSGRLHADTLALRAELSAQSTLLGALCKAGEDGVACSAPESARAVAEQAQRLLRCRIGSELVRPLLQPAGPRSLHQQLAAGATWNKKKGSGQALLGGFRALKLLTMLRKQAGGACPQPGWREVRWSASYIADLWDRSELREPIERSLEFFFSAYYEDRSGLFALTFDEPQGIEAARRNLQHKSDDADPDSVGEIDLWLAGSELGLLESKPLLPMSRVLRAERIPQLFTSAGCAALFDEKAQADSWTGCVWGAAAAPRRPAENSALQRHYLAAHRRAWGEAFDQIGLRDPDRLADDNQLVELVQALGPELDRLLKSAGRGSAGGPETAQRICRDMERSFQLLPAGAPAELDDAQADLIAAHGAYLDALKGLAKALRGVLDGKLDPQAPLRPFEAARQALTDAQKQRQALRQHIEQKLSAQSPPVALEGLWRVLESIEQSSEALLRRRTAQSIEGEWSKLYKAWLPLRQQPGETGSPAERCAQVRGFLEQQVERFLQTYLDPLYDDLARCQAKLGGPTGGKGLLCAAACRQLGALRPLPVCAPAGTAVAPSLAQLPQLDIPPQPGCPAPPDVVFVDTAERGFRYRCANSSGRCEPAGSSSGRASISVQSPSGQSLVLADAPSFSALIARRDDVHVRKFERSATVFTIPAAGACKGVAVHLFLDSSMKEVGDAATWQNPRLLPEQLTCP